MIDMVKNEEIAKIRMEYLLKDLSENDVSKNPFEQFSLWMNEALNSNVTEPTAMTIATSNKECIPSARMVLLKGVDEKGFLFFTNYESHKGKDLDGNPFAALLFFWKELERQVRINGRVEKISIKETEDYFNTRPLNSKIGAWASKQSTVIPDRKFLEEKFKNFEEKFSDKNVPLPSYWGGYRIIPQNFEFWQGRESRLHDRIIYIKVNGSWKIERLSP